MKKILLIIVAVATMLSAQSIDEILKENNCFTCHDINKRKKAPTFKKVAKKNQKKYGAQAQEMMMKSLKNGSRGQYRYYSDTTMPAYENLSSQELQSITTWILNTNKGKKKKLYF